MHGFWKAIWERFQWLGNSLGVISTIVVGLFVAYQYFDSKWKSRIERSLQYAVMAQEPEKVAARNATDLWPPTNTNQSKEDDVQSSTQHIIEHMPTIENIPTKSVAERHLDASGANKCENEIKLYVERIFNEEQKKDLEYKDWRKKIVTEAGFITKIGTVMEIDGERYWFEDNVKYQYTWPIFLKRFFRLDYRENVLEPGSEYCKQLIDHFEKETENTSPGILDQLHELKNFYAALSICTTSGLCDSQVACEIFHADIYRFQEEWRSYFELWSASERGETGYVKLPAFSIHCQSNYYFVGSQVKELTWYQEARYYFQNFWNVW